MQNFTGVDLRRVFKFQKQDFILWLHLLGTKERYDRYPSSVSFKLQKIGKQEGEKENLYSGLFANPTTIAFPFVQDPLFSFAKGSRPSFVIQIPETHYLHTMTFESGKVRFNAFCTFFLMCACAIVITHCGIRSLLWPILQTLISRIFNSF